MLLEEYLQCVCADLFRTSLSSSSKQLDSHAGLRSKFITMLTKPKK